MIFATWWIFVTIISACYTANLTAFLTLSEFTLPIKEPRDIGNKKYHIITVSGSVIEESSLQPLEELYSTLRGASKVFVKYNEQEVLKTWITKRNYIYIAEQPNINIILYKDYLNKAAAGITELNRCTYVMTPWSVFKRPRSFAYSNKFKYSQLFDSVLRTFVEVGLVKYLSQRHLPCFTICPLNLGDKERELLNTDLLLTYYIMILGFTMAIIVFLIEMVVQVINQKNNCIHSRKVISPPPQYSVFGFNNFLNDPRWKKQNINGRDYWVMKSLEGNMKLIPIGSPSALLFQYKLQH